MSAIWAAVAASSSIVDVVSATALDCCEALTAESSAVFSRSGSGGRDLLAAEPDLTHQVAQVGERVGEGVVELRQHRLDVRVRRGSFHREVTGGGPLERGRKLADGVGQPVALGDGASVSRFATPARTAPKAASAGKTRRHEQQQSR